MSNATTSTTSLKRAAANRANSQHSTGPRTESGKAASSQNATTHGFYASLAVIQNDAELREFETLRDSLLADLKPFAGTEAVLFERALVAAWNMRRCDRRVADLATQGIDPINCPEDTIPAKQARNLDLYYRRAESSFHRSLKFLRELQTERAYREASGSAQQTRELSTLVRTQPLRKATLQEDWTKTQIESSSLRNALKVPELAAHRYSRSNSENLLKRM